MRSFEDIHSKVDLIEGICAREVGRNIGALAASARGGMFRALTLVCAHQAPTSIGIASGCFIPSGSPPASETDGPVGAVLLARGIQQLGHHTCLVTDALCVGALLAARDAVDDWTSECPLYVVSQEGITQALDGRAARANFSTLIAIERLGPNEAGEIMSINAEDRINVSGGVHLLFQRDGQATIGIGDGGNELGMGNLSHDLVEENIKSGSAIHCVVKADALIVSGCSNWGALGLLASLCLAHPGDVSSGLLSDGRHHRVLSNLVSGGPAVDGVTGEQLSTVDGLPEVATFEVLAAIREVVASADAELT